MSVISRLYAYRTTPERRPTEDFLTEAFCEWLRLATKAGYLNRVLSELFQVSRDRCLPLESDGEKVSWATQYVIGPGYRGSGTRPDIVGKSGQFFLIIENKIGAGFTEHDDDDGRASQLELYLDYHERQGKKYGGVVLLTHQTSAPTSWQGPVVTWREVHGWLCRLPQRASETKNAPSAFTHWTNSLIRFLEDQNMTGTRIALSDIIALPAFNRLKEGLRGLGSIAQKRLRDLRQGKSVDQLHGLEVPHGSTSGDFNEPNFFGILMTPKGSKADDASFVFWSGVLAGCPYGITPHIDGIPELSVGFGVWTGRSRDDNSHSEIERAIQGYMDKNANRITWRSGWGPWKTDDSKGLFVFQARFSLIELHQAADGGFWDDHALEFFQAANECVLTFIDAAWDDIESLRVRAE